MKRFHVHVAVPDLSESIRFYSTLFGAEPAVRKDDYAKWILDDPRINFAISHRGGASGVNHLGFQVDSDAELESIHGQLAAADSAIVAEKNVSCCYARSDKYWVTDPSGVAWETFHSLGSVPVYEEGAMRGEESQGSACGDGKSACCSTASAKEAKGTCCAN